MHSRVGSIHSVTNYTYQRLIFKTELSWKYCRAAALEQNICEVLGTLWYLQLSLNFYYTC